MKEWFWYIRAKLFILWVEFGSYLFAVRSTPKLKDMIKKRYPNRKKDEQGK